MVFEARYSKWRLAGLAILGLVFAALGWWMLTRTAVDFQGHAGRKVAALGALLGVSAETVGHWLGWICILGGVAALPVVVNQARHPGPAIRINGQGIYWHRWSDKPIPWSNVAKIESISVQHQKMVSVTLIDRNLNRSAGIAGGLSSTNRALGYGDLALTVMGTDAKFDDLVAACMWHASAGFPRG